MRFWFFDLAISTLMAVSATAGPLHLENVELELAAVEGSLEATVEAWSTAAGEPSWLGWHVAMRDGGQRLCCWDGERDRGSRPSCRIEGSHRHFDFSRPDRTPLPVERQLVILIRNGGGRMDEMRVYSDDCPLDAEGRRLIWLEEVSPAASARLLKDLAQKDPAIADEALMALALHQTAEAFEQLRILARTAVDRALQGQAIFWLVQSDGDRTLELIDQILSE